MSIAVACPKCHSRLTAPDTAAGKPVKCPKCQAMMLLPAVEPAADGFEVVDDPPPRPVRRPPPDDEDDRPRRRRFEVDEDDDRPASRRQDRDDEDDYDDRPWRRKKKRPKPAGGVPPALLVGGGVGLLVFLTAVGVGVYMLVGKADNPPAAKALASNGGGGAPAPARPKLPDGWSEVNLSDARVTIHSPVALTPFALPTRPPGGSISVWQGAHNGRVYQVMLLVPDRPPPRGEPPPEFWRGMMDGIAQGSGLGPAQNAHDAAVSGFNGRQATYRSAGKGAVIRMVVANGKVYGFSVIGSAAESSETEPHVSAYLDSAQIG